MTKGKESMHDNLLVKNAITCLKIKQLGSKKAVYSQLVRVFADAHKNNEQDFFQSGKDYELLKGLREILNDVHSLSKKDIWSLNLIEERGRKSVLDD